MDITTLLIVCTILSVDISGSIGIASAFFNNNIPIIKRVSLSKFERFAMITNINSENHENHTNIIQQQCDKQSIVFTSRRSFVSSSITIASTILPNLNANADELNNLHYKSKADGDDDPLVVFGKSLENMGTDSGNGDSSTKDASLSFSDISLPESTDETIASPPPDLSKALKERKDSQKRSVDPRTHG